MLRNKMCQNQLAYRDVIRAKKEISLVEKLPYFNQNLKKLSFWKLLEGKIGVIKIAVDP